MTLISGLQLGQKIGQGVFGEVFSATDQVHGEVAAKIVKRDPRESASDWKKRKASLLNEAVLLKKASHRNVVPIYHLVETDVDDSILYVMEYCKQGCLLKSYTAGPTILEDVKMIAKSAAFGLAELHTNGILHRDIKPSNILRVGSTYKLSDFGVATDDIILGYASAAGYTDHLAPEVFTDGVTSEKTDIWALGMTIYRLLHGKTWYEQLARPRTTVPQGAFANRLSWLPHIPREWRRFVRALLSDDSQSRFNVAQVIDKLGRLPTIPAWKCKVSPTRIVWKSKAGARAIEVTWDRNGQNSWSAISCPETGKKGRSYTLAKGSGASSTVQDELKKFFASRQKV